MTTAPGGPPPQPVRRVTTGQNGGQAPQGDGRNGGQDEDEGVLGGLRRMFKRGGS